MFNFWVYPHLRKMKLPKNSWLNASLCQSVTEILFEVSAWFWDKYLASGTTLAQIATPMVSRGCQIVVCGIGRPPIYIHSWCHHVSSNDERICFKRILMIAHLCICICLT